LEEKTIPTDYLIIGAGIMGLALAQELRKSDPLATVCVIEKEQTPAFHASGRNSGVLHAGFYYTGDSLKAKFTRDGNRLWRDYCLEKNLPMNPCGKVVVAQNEGEAAGILELKKRGDRNGVNVTVIDAKELSDIEPNAKTSGIALWSPNTTTVDPAAICRTLEKDLAASGVRFFYGTSYKKRLGPHEITCTGDVEKLSLIEPLSMPQDSMPTALPGTSGILPTRPFSPSREFTWNTIPVFRKIDRSRPISTLSPIWGNPFLEFTPPSRSMERSRSVPRPFRPSGERTTAVFPDFHYLSFRKFFPGKLHCFYRTTSGFGIWPFMRS